MASGPENGISLSRDPGVSEGSSLDPSSLHVGTDCAEAHVPTAELGGGSDDDAFVPPLPPGDGPGQAIILHGATAPPDESESSYYSTSSDEEEDESQLPPGPIEPARCTATGPGFTGGAAGRPVKMVITAKDAKGRRIREGGSSVVVTLEAPHKSTTLVTAQVQDHADGTYTATYECPAKGPYQLAVTVNGEPMGHSPFPIFFSAPTQDDQTNAAVGPVPSSVLASQAPSVPSGPLSAAQIAGIVPPSSGLPQQNLGAQAAMAGVPFPAMDIDQVGRTVLVSTGTALASGDSVRQVFASCGPIISAQVGGRDRTFAWVEFATATAAAAAVGLDGTNPTLRVQPAAAARAGAEALASSLAATDPAAALALQQAQRFAALSAQQAALAETVLAARAMRAGAKLPAENAADVQKTAALAAAAALAKRLAGGHSTTEDNNRVSSKRRSDFDDDGYGSSSRHRRRHTYSRDKERKSSDRCRSPRREEEDDDRSRRHRSSKEPSSRDKRRRRRSSSRDRRRDTAPSAPPKDELDELFDELEG